MKKFTDWVENNKVLSLFVSREVFTLCYLTVCILLSFPFLINVISPVAKACFLWGVGLIGWDVLTKRRLFRSAYWAAPLLILGAYGLTVLLHRDVLVTGLKHWLHLAISFLLLYTADREAPAERLIRTAKRAFVIVNIITFFGSLASLVMFALQTQVLLERGEETYKQGFFDNRLFGVYASPNPGALLALIAVAGAVFLFLTKDGKKLKCRWFFIVNAVIQFIYFSLTLSKGGLLSAAAAACVLAAFLLVPRLSKRFRPVKTALITLLVCAVAAGAADGAMRGVRFVMSYVPSLISSSGEEGDEDDRIVIERVEEGDETSAIRMVIWSGGWKIVRHALPFGLADANVDEISAARRFDISALTETEKELMYLHNGYFHNIVIQILVYSGAVGLLLFAAFALLLVQKLLRALLLTKAGTRTYHAVAALTALVAALAVNGVGESHLVYHRQDPIGLIFWFCLGLAVALADLYRKSEEGVKGCENDRVVLMVSTPLQALNCLAFVRGNAEDSAGKTDLYLAHPFQQSETVAARLRECGAFNHVYELDAFEKTDSLKGKLTTFYRLFLPEAALKTMARGKLPVKSYSRVGASSQTSASIALRRAYPQATALMFDDGVGSYFGNMVRDYNSPAFNLLNALFFDGALNLDPDTLYLSNPAMSQSGVGAKTLPLPPLTEEAAAEAETVFGYVPNDAYRGKAVYLTQPLEERPGFVKEKEDVLLRLVAQVFGDRAVGRVHPRQQLSSLGEIPVCDIPNLWELECLRQITDESVLIGAYSTALLTPKMLCDKEPTVIFTLRLLTADPDNGADRHIYDLIDGFKASYRNPEKVFVPQTMEELEQILRSVKW